jgi:DNA-binding NtrC family response regulator
MSLIKNSTCAHILIIEDEFMMALMLEEMLKDLGYSISGKIGNIDSALLQIQNTAFDAVILDVNLDGHMTYQLADFFIDKKIPFLFSTGYAQESILNQYAGYMTLQKPYTREQLKTHLEKLLSHE